MSKVELTPRLRQSIDTLLLFIHVQCDTQASKTAQQRNHNQETQILRTPASQHRIHPNPSAIAMFSRQVFCTIRAATLHPVIGMVWSGLVWTPRPDQTSCLHNNRSGRPVRPTRPPRIRLSGFHVTGHVYAQINTVLSLKGRTFSAP
jgi:hypothetical protein